MAKKWHEAGQAFVKSAELQLKQNDAKHEAATNYADAATCFRKVNAQMAADCLQKAAEIYTDMVSEYFLSKMWLKFVMRFLLGSFYDGRQTT